MYLEAIHGTGAGNDIRLRSDLSFGLGYSKALGYGCFARLRYPGVRGLCNIYFATLFRNSEFEGTHVLHEENKKWNDFCIEKKILHEQERANSTWY